MITLKIFSWYTSDQKKKHLVSIFSQLTVNDELKLTLDLLDSAFPFSDATLDSIYEKIYSVVQEGKDEDAVFMKETMRKVHDRLEKEAQESSDEADLLLDEMDL